MTTMHDFGGVLGQRAFEYFRLGSHNATVTALGSCVMWSCVMCDVIHTSHVGFHIDIFRPLKMLWAMVQNHSRVHRKQWGGGGDTLNQCEFKDYEEPWRDGIHANMP